jgi:hypothetical protein
MEMHPGTLKLHQLSKQNFLGQLGKGRLEGFMHVLMQAEMD